MYYVYMSICIWQNYRAWLNMERVQISNLQKFENSCRSKLEFFETRDYALVFCWTKKCLLENSHFHNSIIVHSSYEFAKLSQILSMTRKIHLISKQIKRNEQNDSQIGFLRVSKFLENVFSNCEDRCESYRHANFRLFLFTRIFI